MCSRKIFMPTYSPFLFLILSPLEMRAGALALPLFGYNYRCVLQSCLTLRSRCWMTITGQVSKLALQARSLRGFTQHCTAWAIHSTYMRCRRRSSKGLVLQVQSSPRSLSSSDSRDFEIPGKFFFHAAARNVCFSRCVHCSRARKKRKRC